MSKILVTGAHGQLGSELKELSSLFPNFSFVYTDREHLDITDLEAVERFMNGGDYAALINCAAYTAVDKAESEKDIAHTINGTAAGILARACKDLNVKVCSRINRFCF
jgi:dTDP-4-dehydrorhamnose reductase